MKITVRGEDYIIKKDTFSTQVVYGLYNLQNEEIGSLYYCINQTNARNDLWLININIKPYYQTRGLGQFLFDLLVNDAILAHVNFIEGKYFPTNDHAKPFYEKNGCEIYKEYYDTYVRKDIDDYSNINEYFTKVNQITEQEAIDSRQELLDKQKLTSLFGPDNHTNNGGGRDL